MPGVVHTRRAGRCGDDSGSVVERRVALPRADVTAGDVLVGLSSSGAHTNGYSLIRKALRGYPLDTVLPELGVPLGDALLAASPVLSAGARAGAGAFGRSDQSAGAFDRRWIHRKHSAHPASGYRRRRIRLGSWPVPPLFQVIQSRGHVALDECTACSNGHWHGRGRSRSHVRLFSEPGG